MSELNSDLTNHLNRLHTTELGVVRIKRNLGLETDDAIGWCKEKILAPIALIYRQGKNWYIEADGSVITVNAHSYTVITAHKKKDNAIK